jgi:hypothetical protein
MAKHPVLKSRNLPLYITFALLLGVLANSIFELLKGAQWAEIMLPVCSSAAGVVALSIFFSPWFQRAWKVRFPPSR